jgi:hypothetical protein
MLNDILKNTGYFILLLLIQRLLMDNIQFSGYVNPYIYVLFIILLPFEIPTWILLLLSFAAGLVIDIFNGTPGMHASASVFAGFTRPYVLRLISPREGYEKGEKPGIKTYGMRWFLIYAGIIIFIHHLALFYIEVFSMAYFFNTFLRVMISSFFSIGFILIIQSLIVRR